MPPPVTTPFSQTKAEDLDQQDEAGKSKFCDLLGSICLTIGFTGLIDSII